ncbi:MAG: hypothetical protein JOZ32_05490, partial [Bryobacterales bacterium]|nr:hypothetical protein [Bryobacterales bacterium]
MKIIRNVTIALGALIVLFGIVGILILRSDWFRNYVEQTIITATEDATGGRAQIGTLNFDWTHLSAVATDFVIHGTEPSNVAPLVQIARAQVNLRLFSSLHHWWDITYLGADHPQANVIVYPDGHTNIPSPRAKPASNESPLADIVDLAIGHFELTNGLITYAAQKRQFDLRGNNLRAQLSYNVLNQEYRGQISLQPIYVVEGRNTPVDFTLALPLVVTRNRIDVHDAGITSPQSAVTLNASIEDPRNPRISGHITGHVATADLKNAAGLPLSINAPNIPSQVELDASLTSINTAVDFTSLRLSLGHSNIEVSGSLNSGLSFTSSLALGELGRLGNSTALPNDIASVNGTATLDSQDNLTLSGLRAAGLGAEFSGDASLKDFTVYQVRGDLRHLDLETALRAARLDRLPYDGGVSGSLDIAGNLKTGLRSLTAQTKLSIAPGSRGIPLSGRLAAIYSGATDNLTISNSLLTLPHTRIKADGSVGKQLTIAMTTTNLNDLLALAPPKSRPEIALHSGQASFTGTVTGRLSAPRVAGHFTANRFSVEGREFDSFNADASLNKDGVDIQDGGIARGAMQARFSGKLGLHDWTPVESAPIAINASIQNGDLADLLALAGQPSRGYSGQLSANTHISGTIGNPQGAGTLTVINGMIEGQPFDRAQAQVNLSDQLVTVPSAFIQIGPGRVNFSGQYQHPRDSFTTGQLQAQVQSDQIDLAQVSALQQQRPKTAGIIQLNAKVTGKLTGQSQAAGAFQLTSINGNATVRGLRSEGQTYGDLTANATTSGQAVTYKVTSNFAGSNIDISGNTQLTRDYPTSARASLNDLPVQQLLALANRTDIPVKGMLSGTASVMGTINNPQGSVDLTLSKGMIYRDPVDRLHARVNYLPQSVDVPEFELVSGPSRLDLSAQYNHPAGNLESGNLQFRVNTSSIDLTRVKTLVENRPGLSGTLQMNASGAVQVRPAAPEVLVQDLNGNIKATNVAMDGNNLGNLAFNATTSAGRVNFTLDSGLAGASIEGRGNVQLASDYPTEAQLNFKNVSWAGLKPLLGPGSSEVRGFEASADGGISLNGSLLKPQELRGSVQVTRLQISAPPSAFSNPGAISQASHVLVQNQGPIAATLSGETLKIQSAHITGPETDFQASGAIPLDGEAMNVALNGNINLAILQQFNRSITSSGSIMLIASVRGTVTEPRLAGQIE